MRLERDRTVLEVWASVAPQTSPNYISGTWGPPSAEALIAQDGRQWSQPVFLDQPNQEDEMIHIYNDLETLSQAASRAFHHPVTAS